MVHTPDPEPTPTELVVPRQRIARGLHDFARAVRHIHDLKTFLDIFQVGLENSGVCARVQIGTHEPDVTGHRPQAFGIGRLSLGVGDDAAPAAIAQLAPPAHKKNFDAEDLHLLSGLSEILGAAVALAQRVNRDERMLAALKALLNFAPVGICAFDAEGRVQTVNTLARAWLALAEGDDVATAMPADLTAEQRRAGGSFHLRVAGRLLFCESRRAPDSDVGLLVLTDLTPEQGQLLDTLGREVYRAHHLRRPLHFVLLERPAPIGALLAHLPEIRATLGTAAIAGPYDATRAGIVFPDAGWSTVVLWLRRIAAKLDAAQVRVGYASLRSFHETPEALVSATLNQGTTLAALVRPRLLVHDEYRGVGDSLRLMLRGQCDVSGSTNAAEAQRLLAEQHFDAVLADLDTPGGEDLVAKARAGNERLRAFYLSGSLPGHSTCRVANPGDGPVFSKPFDVGTVRERILASLSDSSPAEQT